MSGSSNPPTHSFSAEEFFATQEPPSRLSADLDIIKGFVDKHAQAGRRIVLVTSGGTTVPLEHNVVRFLDNFSAGTRGAASAEYFLRTGQYAVIFLHRQHSLQPFSRHYSHTTNPFLDLLDVTSDSSVQTPSSSKHASDKSPPNHLFPPPVCFTPAGSNRQECFLTSASPTSVTIRQPHLEPMISLLRSYKLVKSLDLLLPLSFVTVHDYLFLLRGTAQILANPKVGRNAMFYLAAAVSDFFIPHQKMAVHKIQSGKGSLTLEMDQVPKILKPLVEEWSQQAFIVSFKLETDPDLLISKAKTALERYHHQIVIGNDLARRKFEVVFVTQSGEKWVRMTPEQVDSGEEIEQEIINDLAHLHAAWIEHT